MTRKLKTLKAELRRVVRSYVRDMRRDGGFTEEEMKPRNVRALVVETARARLAQGEPLKFL